MARYYDLEYDELVNYKCHCDVLERIFRKHYRGRVKSILDVGCGTGNHAIIFAQRGYRATGIDLSDAMLAGARKKVGSSDNPRFHRMDMRQIDLGEKFDVALVLFAGFGYLLKDTDLRSFFSSVKRHLNEGLLIYEFWQNSGIHPEASQPSGLKRWVKTKDKKAKRLLIRLDRSTYDAQTHLQTIHFDFYVIDSKTRRVTDIFSETHMLRTYSISEMKYLLMENGFTSLAFYDGKIPVPGEAYTKTLRSATYSTFRVTSVARSARVLTGN